MSELRINCIYCEHNGLSPDVGKHLYVNRTKLVFFCQRCNTSGVWIGTLPTPQRVFKNRYSNIELFNFSIKGQNPIGNKVFDYITQRLPEDVVREKVRWCPTIERAFFPLWVNGKVKVWNARAVDDTKPKYLTHGEKSKYVYGLEETKDWAVLCEGPMDALSSPNGIAIFGKYLSDTQFSLIASKYRKIYWAMDFDTRGQKNVEEQKKKLSKYVEIIDLKLEQDPNSLGKDKMNEILRLSGECKEDSSIQ